MTTITIKNGIKPSKTVFENWEDFLIEWVMMQEEFELTPEHIKILKSREKEADNALDEGLTWDEVKSGIRRNV